jgi:hypothetical protein
MSCATRLRAIGNGGIGAMRELVCKLVLWGIDVSLWISFESSDVIL